MKTLKLDEKEALVSAIDHDDCYNGVVKLIEECCANREQAVVKFSLTSSNSQELILTKACADGARLLATDLFRVLSSLKKRPQ